MDKQSQLPSHQILEHQPRKNYGGRYQSGGHQIKCYTKKQMKSLYPGQDFERVAEFVPGSKKTTVGVLEGKRKRPVYAYKSHNRLLYHEKGYLAVGEDRYVALLKSAVPVRLGILAAFLVLVAAGVVFALNVDKLQQVASVPDEQVAEAGKQLELEEGAVDWEGARPQDTGGVVPGIAIPGYKSITVDANKTDVKVNFQNPEGNPCYFEISLLLDDGTELYKSKMVEPGKGIYDISLSKALESGEYGAMVKYSTYSLTDMSPMNGAEVKITLIAQ